MAGVAHHAERAWDGAERRPVVNAARGLRRDVCQAARRRHRTGQGYVLPLVQIASLGIDVCQAARRRHGTGQGYVLPLVQIGMAYAVMAWIALAYVIMALDMGMFYRSDKQLWPMQLWPG